MQPTRSFYDGQGIMWHVTERSTQRPGHAPRQCLYFEAAHAIRRVCSYPANWRALSDRKLEQLSWAI